MWNENSAPASLPDVLPVFPLTGVLVFPGMILPLHIFEPRYRNMVEDALEAGAVFGMIQPVVPRQDNRPSPGSEKESPELYRIGCAGYIERWEQLADGRYVLELRGINRFRAEEELALLRGYRRVKANYGAFSDSAADREWICDRGALMNALKGYAQERGVVLPVEQVEPLSNFEFVNILAMSLPFHPAEKQALLEAPSLQDREKVLLDLLRFGSAHLDPGQVPPARTVH